MKRILFICLLLPIGLTAQVSQWINTIGGTANDIGIKSTVDINGDIYATGSFQGTNIDFDPSANTFFLSSSGSSDCFVAKYDKDGNFKWAFKIGGSNTDDVKDIELDHSGHI